MLQFLLSYFEKLVMSPFNPKSSATCGIAWTFVSLLLAGCGGGGIEKLPLYPASGTLQMDGKPFGPVSLRFEPETPGGRGFVASVDAAGKINAVTTYKVGDGAPVGTYKVTVFSSMGASKQFPAKYENAKSTPLKVIIADTSSYHTAQLTRQATLGLRVSYPVAIRDRRPHSVMWRPVVAGDRCGLRGDQTSPYCQPQCRPT